MTDKDIKLECIKIAASKYSLNDGFTAITAQQPSEKILADAKAFYDFITG